MKKHSRCAQLSAVVRILVGAALLFFGISKLGADAALQNTIGGAGHAMGLTFLSTTVRFWIAVIGEIIAGLSLLFGYKAKWGAILAIIIMIFAWNFTGWNLNVNAILVLLGSVIVLRKGTGAWALEPAGGCAKGGCCGSGCCEGDNCSSGGACCSEKDDDVIEVE